MEWIRVDDRLPKGSRELLTCCRENWSGMNSQRWTKLRYIPSRGVWVLPETTYVVRGVTHWAEVEMPDD